VIPGSAHTDLKSYDSFKEYFETEVKQPFTKWHELEETYHYVTTYAPELLTTTYSEARKTSQLHIIAASKEPETGKVLPEGGDQRSEKKRSLHESGSDLSQKERAKKNGISYDSQQKLDWLARNAPEHLERVRNGEISVHRACIQAGYIKERRRAIWW
jgi:hypothetical protein